MSKAKLILVCVTLAILIVSVFAACAPAAPANSRDYSTCGHHATGCNNTAGDDSACGHHATGCNYPAGSNRSNHGSQDILRCNNLYQ